MLKFTSIHEANAALNALADGQRVEVLGRIARVDKSLNALCFACHQQVVKAQPDRRFTCGKKGGHRYLTPVVVG